MGEMLQADADALRALAGTLSGVADAVEGIAVTATVTMPGSPVTPATEQATDAVLVGYRHIGASVRQMSTACDATANSYEAVDSAFATQLDNYERGL